LERLFSTLLVILMILGLVACTGSREPNIDRVQCPACGYEFNALAGEN